MQYEYFLHLIFWTKFPNFFVTNCCVICHIFNNHYFYRRYKFRYNIMRKVCLFRKAINAALLITCLKFITAQFPLLIRMVSCKYLSSVIFTQPTPSPQSFFEHSSSILSSSMSLISVTPGSSSSLIHSQQPKHRDTCVRDDIKSRRGRSS